MTTRNIRAASPAPPLTPDLLGSRALEIVQRERIEELAREVKALRGALEYARRQHVKTERVLVKYVDLLEAQITLQREAVKLLGAPLVPMERK